ncbi:MAG: sigma 54-interacting transcriptional regulator [Desulfovibrionaceae bacterium]|nr:sigma 54-interacting transcriptional regulator [Desulfovibrionaceae bacterium]
MLADYLDYLCDVLEDAMCITDAQGICVLVNRRHAEITGIKKEEILGKRVQDLVDLGLFDTVINSRIVKTGEEVSEVQKLANGKTIVLDGHPLKDPDGQVVYVVTILRDITSITNMRRDLQRQNELLETFQQLNSQDKSELKAPLIMHSKAMQDLYKGVGAIAETDVTVLLLGETGVGKDVIARRIHHESKRSKGPFVKVDCGSIPENLIETELFGYAPGSFSGASRHGKAGLVEAASSGTLFLDEIGELPLPMQSRLLRVLQDFEVMRVGATTPKNVDVRVIAATNKNLEHEVDQGRFRSDLYYRLRVAVLHIPPLRERQADILPLAQSFLKYYATRYNKKMRFSQNALDCMLSHSWPGNVRELENMIQGMVATAQHTVLEVEDLPHIGKIKKIKLPSSDYVLPSLDGRSLKDMLKEVEQILLAKGLEKYGSIAELARHFQQDRSTIFRKIKEMEAQGFKLPGNIASSNK